MLSISSLKAAQCAGIGVAAESLVVLELSTASREVRPPPSEDGAPMEGRRGEDIGVLPMTEERWAKALAACQQWT